MRRRTYYGLAQAPFTLYRRYNRWPVFRLPYGVRAESRLAPYFTIPFQFRRDIPTDSIRVALTRTIRITSQNGKIIIKFGFANGNVESFGLFGAGAARSLHRRFGLSSISRPLYRLQIVALNLPF